MIKTDDTTTTNSPATPALVVCGNCGVEDRRLLHYLRHRGIFRRLCTTCVLRLNPQSFCPTCFQVYSTPPSDDAVLTCFKCYSSSHIHCVAAGHTSTPSSYICPLCLHPNTPIFKLKTLKEANLEGTDIGDAKSENCRVLDRDGALKLLAAARIAFTSISKAAVASKAEAERRAKEAAFTRKRAREALEHVAHLMVKEKMKKKEVGLIASGEVVGPGLCGAGSNLGYSGRVKMERDNNGNVSSSSNNRNGSMTTSLAPSVVVEEKINTMVNVDRMANSNQVLAALNAVELRENEKMRGITAQDVGPGVPVNDNHEVMDMDDKVRMRVTAGENVGGLVQELDNDDGDDHMESGVENINTQGEKLEDVNNEVVSVQQYKDNSNGEEVYANGGSL